MKITQEIHKLVSSSLKNDQTPSENCAHFHECDKRKVNLHFSSQYFFYSVFQWSWLLSFSAERQQGAFVSGNHIITQHIAHLQKRQMKSTLFSFWYDLTSPFSHLNPLAISVNTEEWTDHITQTSFDCDYQMLRADFTKGNTQVSCCL